MSKSKLKARLRALPVKARKELLPGFDDEEFEALLEKEDHEILRLIKEKDRAVMVCHGQERWFQKRVSGLSNDGQQLLKDLASRFSRFGTTSGVDQKQLKYLEQLGKMELTVPDLFCSEVDAKGMYKRLLAFCRSNDIPEDVVRRVVPALVKYIETGRLRPIIIAGEPGCGKTTAVKLLVQEALHLPTEVIKIPQADRGHGMTGDCGTYQAADCGALARARLRANSMLVAYVFDEIDKVTHNPNRTNLDDELLSITDESCADIVDSYIETKLVGLEHCPMFMTANDIQNVSPILADRCMVINFPNANADRIKSIARKYVEKLLESNLYKLINFDYQVMDRHIDSLVERDVTSLRKHQQMIETAVGYALSLALEQTSDDIVSITESMFDEAEKAVLGSVKRRPGFAG